MTDSGDLSEQDRLELLSAVRAEAVRLGQILGVASELLPTIGDIGSAHGCWLELNHYPDADEGERYLLSLNLREGEKVWCLSEVAPDYSAHLLEPLFVSLTHQIAMTAVGNPSVGDVPKEALFAIQDALLTRLYPEWALRSSQRHSAILTRKD